MLSYPPINIVTVFQILFCKVKTHRIVVNIQRFDLNKCLTLEGGKLSKTFLWGWNCSPSFINAILIQDDLVSDDYWLRSGFSPLNISMSSSCLALSYNIIAIYYCGSVKILNNSFKNSKMLFDTEFEFKTQTLNTIL